MSDSHTRNRVILVIGTHRSGTSATAGVLHHLGVWMGFENPKDGNPWNKKGFFEHIEFQELNDKVLGGWEEPDVSVTDEQTQKYKGLIAREKHHKLWGMKDPRLCFTAQWIAPLFEREVRVIAVQRPFDVIVASLHRRENKIQGDEWTRDKAIRITKEHLEAREEFLGSFDGAVMNVSYPKLCNNRRKEVERIADFVFDKHPSEERIQSAVKFVVPGGLKSAPYRVKEC